MVAYTAAEMMWFDNLADSSFLQQKLVPFNTDISISEHLGTVLC